MCKEKKVYENALSIGLVEHKFNGVNCVFFTGLKFSKYIINGEDVYKAYNTRSSNYKELEEDEVDLILKYGIVNCSLLFGYNMYKELISSSNALLESKSSNSKSVKKECKKTKYYMDRCESILSSFPEILNINKNNRLCQ